MSPASTPKTAIVLIDPYNDFLHPNGKAYPRLAESLADTNTILNLQNLVTTARARKIPIYYGLHQQVGLGFLAGWSHPTPMQENQLEHKTFEEGSWGVEIFKGLEPDVQGNGDVVVSKHWCSSSFQNTDLDYQLKQRDITDLVFGGLTANTCLESTARYAYELGYHVTMLKDATAGFTTVAKDAATDLIWPLFANEVLTVEEWKESLAK
ncbi:hypothetical protein MFRU_055g00320 [Monilinia fructicola]|uniref:Isochorismatase-like domain-containing protein n=1 Tax=Monilinia fructicola TaxID=38448 RepID=A0A5M9JTV4_MONFR|nr:hypothetical protein EYC84_000565 [Monilinia fructicola]KAG4025559.1 hypothetical protein MFRU_055g00320 [Monilinia fructicola]